MSGKDENKEAVALKAKAPPPSATLLARIGISDSRKCANILGAITLDVLVGRISPQVGNTSCNAIGKLMKLKEMEIRYGVSDGEGGPKRLSLTD